MAGSVEAAAAESFTSSELILAIIFVDRRGNNLSVVEKARDVWNLEVEAITWANKSPMNDRIFKQIMSTRHGKTHRNHTIPYYILHMNSTETNKSNQS